MTKSHVWLGLCLLMGLALAGGSTDGQEMPRGEAIGGASMDKSSAAFVAAFKDGDTDAIFNLLAPWVQDSAALAQARFAKRLKAGEFEGDEEAMLKRYDPTGRLGLKNLSEVASADPAKYFAFQTRLALMFSELDRAGSLPKWYRTERAIGLVNRWDLMELDSIQVTPWGGRVFYENVDEESIELLYSLDGDTWMLDDVVIIVGVEEVNFRESLNWALGREKSWTLTEEARAAEAEQMLSSVRNQARVAYAKAGTAPDSLSDTDVEQYQRKGEYYTVRDTIYSFKSGDLAAGIAAEPDTVSDPWLLLKFNWKDGQSEFERLESKEKLDAKIKELQEG